MDRNISKLYTSGADIVLSLASMASNRILNTLKPDEIMMLAEGLSIFTATVPLLLIGKTLAGNNIRKNAGCNVVAIRSGGQLNINPTPEVIFKRDDELILIGTAEAERLFLENYT
jgi:K+/H+ antiporter YhaU regulatory subunit KhtT